MTRTHTASSAVPASLLCYLHACPICGAATTSHYCRVPSLFTVGEFITYERCTSCDVVFRNPRLPDDERLRRYVEQPFVPQRATMDGLSTAHCAQMARRLRGLVQSRASRLLDFGCGTGGFLVEARAAGFEVMGLEVGRALAQFVTHSYGIPVFSGVVTDPRFAGERFDVIVSRQVFEHLTDPKSTLIALKARLKPRGLLLIEVPNLRHIRERLHRGSTMDDSHLFYFNRRSLSRLLQTCGFDVVQVSEGLRPFRLLGANGRPMSDAFVRSFESVAAVCQIRTGLSVIGRLR